MNIYKLTSSVDAYETYDSMVVVAKNEHEARLIHPSNKPDENICWDGKHWIRTWICLNSQTVVEDDRWECPNDLTAEYVGVADEKYQTSQVLVASFNAA